MSTDTATVEVLTAEVRVLMVGSRQVTLSVVRQLDEVDADLIEPFGRVRAARKPGAGQIEVIGSAEGILSYSTAEHVRHHCYLNQGAVMCTEHFGILTEHGYSMDDVRTKYLGNQRWAWPSHHWSEFFPSREMYDNWAELPLIVLAGLR